MSLQVGQTLLVSNGTWTGDPTSFTYQWRRGGEVIIGSTGVTYVVSALDIGSALSASVVAINLDGTSAPATSAFTELVVAVAGSLDFSQASNSALLTVLSA